MHVDDWFQMVYHHLGILLQQFLLLDIVCCLNNLSMQLANMSYNILLGDASGTHLGCSSSLEALEHDISHPLAGQHIPAHHCRLCGGAEQALGGYADCDGGQAALVEGYLLGYHTPEGVDDG